jgi:hypothetical protein
MTARERKRRQRLRESNGESFFGFRFDAMALEDLLVGAGHLHAFDAASKSNIARALTAYLRECVTCVTDAASTVVATCQAITSAMVEPMDTTAHITEAKPEAKPEVELIASRDGDGSYRYELRLRPATSGRCPVPPPQGLKDEEE